ncbi:MAG TPA: hypothetical protein VIG35_01185 [Gaiellaceae bacterium]|jgi:hypothetical protein
MRRLSVILCLFTVFAVPAAALAGLGNSSDGSLVVKNGTAPYNPGDTTPSANVPVVQLTITGSVIGQVVGTGKLVIDAGPTATADAEPIVTGAGLPSDSPRSDTAQVWKGSSFKFRAVGGAYTVLVYGDRVNLVAVGTGTVRLAGTPDSATDGRYSLNGNDFVSLPGVQTDKRFIGANG